MLSSNLSAFAKKCGEIPAPRRLNPLLGLCLAWMIASMTGCGDNPGQWSKERLSAHVKQSLSDQGIDVTEVNLAEQESGGFAGTATAADGETFKLIVTQDPVAHRITWDAEGDRGSFLDGYYELK